MNITKVLSNSRIVLYQFMSFLQLFKRLVVFLLFVIYPAECVYVCAIIRIELDRFTDMFKPFVKSFATRDAWG